MTTSAETQNDFSKGSIPKTILRLAIPMTVAQLINILYNLVDRMFIGHMEGTGRLALTGLGITMPIISIIIGFSNLCGMGGSPLASMERGKGNKDEAERLMGNSFCMLLILGVIVTAAGLIFKKPLLYAFGASDDTFPYANTYLAIYLLGTIMVMISLGMNPFINAQGFAKTGMMTVAIGAVVNTALDPLFIYVFKMGIKGAALATVIGQTCSAAWVLMFLTGKKAILKLRLPYIRLNKKKTLKILGLGVSGFTLSFTGSLVQVVCNKTLQVIGGDLFVSVMTVINSIRELAFAALNGCTNGATPVISYNYGAQKYSRIRESIRFVTVAAVSCAAVVWALTMLCPGALIKIFNQDPELLAVGIPSFRIYYVVFILASLQLAGQVTFLSLGHAKKAIFFSFLRKAIIVAPLAVILPHVGNLGVNGVFLAEPISTFVGGLCCYLTMMFTVYIPMGKLTDKQEERS